MPILLILRGLIEQQATKDQAVWFMKSQGFGRGYALHLFQEYGIEFPQEHRKEDERHPTFERKKELQELSFTL